ncbi:rod shape-determining protein MreD [Shimia thalassica]|uniref:rod shape-determining protein MreD n=1 Tax=Shimia thalassica TaxID=1715693 RepID=UPI0027365CE5|nr:rod shape-determining protein MreD [Shimia thalassica]MDP2493150.1 rod shape-determining protein MreD [Shimia thalassica]
MGSASASRKWRMRFLYVLLGVGILFLQLLPLSHVPQGWAGPDFIVVLTIVWAARRPDFVPVVAVAGVVLLADFVLMRPPGLMAAIMVVARQMMRRQSHGLRDSTFANEWLTASAILIGIAVLYRLVLAVFLVDQAPLGLSVMQAFMNVAVYPLVAILSQVLVNVRKLSPGDDDTLAGAT